MLDMSNSTQALTFKLKLIFLSGGMLYSPYVFELK